MEKVSIVIPAYNSESQINKCLSSILKQSYEHLEIIVVNDGSTDGTKKILDEYAKMDSRIKVLHQKNTGVSATRNAGIELVTGEWIQFVDADDALEPTYIEKMIENIDDEDLLISSYKVMKMSGEYILRNFTREGSFVKSRFLEDMDYLVKNNLLNPLWNKLFRADIILKHNILMNEVINMGEDLLFVIEYLKKSEKIKLVNLKETYLYFDDANAFSLTKKLDFKYFNMNSFIIDETKKFLIAEKAYNENLEKELDTAYTLSVLGFSVNYFLNTTINKNEVIKILSQVDIDKMNDSLLNIKYKIFFNLLLQKKIVMLKLFIGIYKKFLKSSLS